MRLTKQAAEVFRSAEISAVVIRVDGTRKDLGVVSAWHANPFVRAWRRVRIAMRKRWAR